jgi:REP element-mobilizing transposase RayT
MMSQRDVTAPCWFHVILTTYGAWLPGDARAFRTRHHRDHVDGDYKNPPPPGVYESFALKNRDALKYDAISLDRLQRETVGKALKAKLDELNASLIAISVSSQHIHLLLKLPPKTMRLQVGDAKKHAWFELRDTGWKAKLWGKRGKYLRIRDRGHQLNAFYYILRHADQGAWVWYYTRSKTEKEY